MSANAGEAIVWNGTEWINIGPFTGPVGETGETGETGADSEVPGPTGPQGPPGQWVSMTLAEFEALPTKDPDTLYVIVS